MKHQDDPNNTESKFGTINKVQPHPNVTPPQKLPPILSNAKATSQKVDIFVSHASADKEGYIYPFIKALDKSNITYWVDESEIKWGDNITLKINEGLEKAKYIVVFLSRSFLDRNWPQAELLSALSLEISVGRTIVLPLLIASEEEVFGKYPLLRDKLYLNWESGLDNVISNLQSILYQDKEIYSSYESHIETIEINNSLNINEIRFGERSQIEFTRKDNLLILDNKINLPKEYVDSEGRNSHVIKSLFNEQELMSLRTNEHQHFPREITVQGQRSRAGTTVAVYICTDIFYFQDFDHNPLHQVFEVNCLLGRGGISDFVDKYGNIQTGNKFILGDGLGAIGAIVAVEFEGEKPICRSNYVIVTRAGIRYPDDVWISKKTNKPITSVEGGDISKARFVFQSRQPNGGSTDIYSADFNGERMINMTQRQESAYDGFYDADGNEIVEWVDEQHIIYCSMQKGRKVIVKAQDPFKNETNTTRNQL